MSKSSILMVIFNSCARGPSRLRCLLWSRWLRRFFSVKFSSEFMGFSWEFHGSVMTEWIEEWWFNRMWCYWEFDWMLLGMGFSWGFCWDSMETSRGNLTIKYLNCYTLLYPTVDWVWNMLWIVRGNSPLWQVYGWTEWDDSRDDW
jgi:hypothetical protein